MRTFLTVLVVLAIVALAPASPLANGGAFGGKEDMSNQAQTALAAWVLERPVKCTLSREESLLMHPKRHPVRIDLEVGCASDGKLTRKVLPPPTSLSKVISPPSALTMP